MLHIYIDTSVLGGCADVEFAEDSLQLMELARCGKIVLLISDVVVQELADAPPSIAKLLGGLPEASVEAVALSDDVLRLRDAYLAAGIVGPKWTDDATHVAAATVAQADAIVSWNFKHIVRLDKIKAYNEINQTMGFGAMTIITPKEVRYDDED